LARRRPLLLAGAAVATGAFALAGHTTATSPRAVAMGADVVHVWAAAAWFGGIGLLALVLRWRSDDQAIDTGRVVVRFSRIATVSVVAVGIAGGVLAWTEVRAVRALTSTTYGWLLVAKVALVAIVAVAGAYNHFRLVPALERAPKRAGALLRRTVRLEAVLMVGAVALTAVLVNVTPARTAAGITGIYSEIKPLGDGSVNLVVDPARKGLNAMHLYVLDRSGRNIDVEGLTVELSLPSSGIAPITRDPFAAGPGHYQLDGVELTIAGTWAVVVKARVSRFEEQTATFEVPIYQ
jgi:copper transport protein